MWRIKLIIYLRHLWLCLSCKIPFYQHIPSSFGWFRVWDSVKGTVSRDFLLQVKIMNHLPPRPKITFGCTISINDTGGRFATGINDTAIVPPVPLMLLIPVANNGNNQTADILKWPWRKKFMYSTAQKCSKKIIKTFLFEDFFHLPPVSVTPVVHLELRISLWMFKKNWNGPNGILRGLGETDS